MTRPVKTMVRYDDYLTFTRFQNGSSTQSTVSGTTEIIDDHPLVGSAGNYVGTTPYAVRWRRVHYPTGKVHGISAVNGQYRLRSGNLYAGGLSGPGKFGVIPSTLEWPSLEAAAARQCLDDLKSQAANLLVFYAERMEAGQLILLMAARAVSAARAIKRKMAKALAKKYSQGPSQYSAKHKRKVYDSWYHRFYDAPTETLLQKGGTKVTEMWLEYVFGWRPLLQEAAGVINAVAEPKSQVVKYVRTRSSKTSERLNEPLINALGATFQWKGTRDTRQSVRCTLHAEMIAPGLASAASLGLTNPLSLAWELVPFSWVVDPFWDLSSWLSTLDASIGWRILPGSCVSRRAFTKGEYVAHPQHPQSSTWKWISGLASCAEDINYFERDRFQEPISLPRLELPSTLAMVQTFANLQSIFVGILNGSSSATRSHSGSRF